MPPDRLNIGELSRRSGIPVSAIRYYESLGLVPPPPRVGNWRTYPPSTLGRLRVIRAARDLGFTIEELRILVNGLDDPISDRWRTLAETKLPEIERQIEQATQVKRLFETALDCTCDDVEECFGEGGVICKSSTALIPVESVNVAPAKS